MTGVTKELLEKRAQAVRLGGKGTVRRKSKGVHKTSGGDDKKFQGMLKKLGAAGIGDIEEVSFHREDESVTTFKNPRVDANIPGHTYVIRGKSETKKPDSQTQE